MKILRLFAVLTFGMLILVVPAFAQQRDPLTEKEVNQLRDSAQESEKRMHLLVTFAKARMELLDHLRSDQNMANTQVDKIQETLDDLANLVDEIDDNLTTYNGHGEELRKSLREVIEMDSDFQLKLRTIKETSTPQQLKQYGFALENATESVNSSGDASRAMLDDQNAKKGKEKLDKEEKKSAKKKPSKDAPKSDDASPDTSTPAPPK